MCERGLVTAAAVQRDALVLVAASLDCRTVLTLAVVRKVQSPPPTTPSPTPVSATATVEPTATATPTPTATPTATAMSTPSSLSAGCADLNEPIYDGYWNVDATDPLSFNAGETITIAATTPQGGPVTSLVLVNGLGTPLATASFPGTLTYTFASATSTDLEWSTDSSSPVTWSVSCPGS